MSRKKLINKFLKKNAKYLYLKMNFKNLKKNSLNIAKYVLQ